MASSDTSALDVQKHMSDPRIQQLSAMVTERYDKANLIGHGIDHIQRVLINALVIGETEDCRMPIVIAAVLLHDIGFLSSPEPEQHNVTGAAQCASWLDGWTQEEKEPRRGSASPRRPSRASRTGAAGMIFSVNRRRRPDPKDHDLWISILPA